MRYFLFLMLLVLSVACKHADCDPRTEQDKMNEVIVKRLSNETRKEIVKTINKERLTSREYYDISENYTPTIYKWGSYDIHIVEIDNQEYLLFQDGSRGFLALKDCPEIDINKAAKFMNENFSETEIMAWLNQLPDTITVTEIREKIINNEMSNWIEDYRWKLDEEDAK